MYNRWLLLHHLSLRVLSTSELPWLDLAFVFRVRVGEISVEKVQTYGDLQASTEIQCLPQAHKKAHSVSTGNLKDEKMVSQY